MSFYIPDNQPVSWTIYNQAISVESKLPHDFLASQKKRIHRAFDHGEPIWMIVDELQMVFKIKPERREKTPLQLAIQVVRT